MKFVVTRRPLQFTHHTGYGFCGIASENQLLLLLPVIQFCVIHFKTLRYTNTFFVFLSVHFSACLHSFSSLALSSLCIHVT